MNNLISMLHAEGCSCVIRREDGKVRLCHERGVKDLYHLLTEEPEWLRNAQIADKVIGKAAAALMAAGGAKEVYADIISRPALALFHAADIQAGYKEQVDHIINRTRTGWCPLETLCHEEQDINKILILIKNFIETPNH